MAIRARDVGCPGIRVPGVQKFWRAIDHFFIFEHSCFIDTRSTLFYSCIWLANYRLAAHKSTIPSYLTKLYFFLFFFASSFFFFFLFCFRSGNTIFFVSIMEVWKGNRASRDCDCGRIISVWIWFVVFVNVEFSIIFITNIFFLKFQYQKSTVIYWNDSNNKLQKRKYYIIFYEFMYCLYLWSLFFFLILIKIQK